MGQIIYSFVSSAARTHEGHACLEGMHLLAEILHHHDVPVTWLVSGESAHLAANQLTGWHTAYGDEVALHMPKLEQSAQQVRSQIIAERDAVQEALPWANLSVAGHGHQHPELVPVLEELGFEALWGFCWEQIECDGFYDRGCPWGSYYIDPAQRLKPAQGKGILAFEWTARDLLKSFHSGAPMVYSTDPNDVARAGLCSWENIDYWKSLADNYIRNARYNETIFLVQHQEAHEMESNDHFRCYTEEDVRETATMLSEFIPYVKRRACAMPLHDAARIYNKRYPKTEPSYMLWRDTPTPPLNPDYCWDVACGPWPRTFLYYDMGAQMMFVEGKATPVCIRNYGRDFVDGNYFSEPIIPCVRMVRNTAGIWRRELEFEVNAPAAMPYGVAVWGDFSLYRIGDAPGLLNGKILAPELLFLRYDLQKGVNKLVVKLEGK